MIVKDNPNIFVLSFYYQILMLPQNLIALNHILILLFFLLFSISCELKSFLNVSFESLIIEFKLLSLFPFWTNEEKRKKKKSFQSQFQRSKNKNLNINNVYTGKTSYTMSGGDCHYNLRSERIKLIEKRNKEYLNAFGDNILSSINQPFNIKNKDDKYFEDINNRRLEYQKNLIEERKSKMGKFEEMREKNYEKLNEKFLIKSQSYKERYKEYDAEVVAIDPLTDLAILQIDWDNFTPIEVLEENWNINI